MRYMRNFAGTGVVHMANDEGRAVCGVSVAEQLHQEASPKRVDCQQCLVVLEEAVIEQGRVAALLHS